MDASQDVPLSELVADTIRVLSIEAVQRANSGHPGAPMGMADFAAVLSMKFLKVCPTRPDWPDRDRLVLSAGHASTLLYSLFHVMGFKVSREDLMAFRQWDSSTPGHPEHGRTPGVETTTGPLGQGLANGVGMALAERMLAARCNAGERVITDHTTWVIASDGDMMEGVQSEAASLAGHLGLGRLIVWYDSNRITIDGSTDLTFTEDVGRRYEAMGWHVQSVDAHDHHAIEAAIVQAREATDRPSLIVGSSHIACKSPGKQDSASSHGSPLGEEEVRAVKAKLSFPADREFHVPGPVQEFFKRRLVLMEKEVGWWEMKAEQFEHDQPEQWRAWRRALIGEVPPDLPLPVFEPGASIATRKASHRCLNAIAAAVPALVGGSADLAESNKTDIQGSCVVSRKDFSGRILRFGIREHGMAAICNGLALHGGFRPFTATFLVFSDYMRPPMRLAALMGLPVIHVFTHDSLFVGEDGPTHQPVEHLAALRVIPNLRVLRPADASETAVAWAMAVERTDGPTTLVLTRQGLPVFDPKEVAPATGVRRGGYVLYGGEDEPRITLIATGSEVSLALAAGRSLREAGIRARVVSMPCPELFLEQDVAWRDAVLPPATGRRLVVEAGVHFGWDRFLAPGDRFLGMDRFGASAPASELATRFGFTKENVLSIAREMLDRHSG
jgi:transketolase